MLPLVPRSQRLPRYIPVRLPLFLLALAGLLIPAAHASTCTVYSLPDTIYPGTLRFCLTAVSSGDTIQFVVKGTVTLTSALPQITQNLTIAGPGANTLTISGANSYQVFNIASGPTVTISGLTIANGNINVGDESFGGGILNAGTLTMENCAFTGNSSNSYGGGITNAGMLTVSNSTFSGNSAVNHGGAIYSYGTLAVSNSAFSGNSSQHGGAIDDLGNIATVTNSTFSGNSAATIGGAIYSQEGTLTVTNSTFSGNSSSEGGGIGGFFGPMTVTNSTFSGNSSYSRGGGIFIANPTTIGMIPPASTVNNSIFSGNSAPTGGGIYNHATLNGSNNILGADIGGECDGPGTGCFTNGVNGNQVGLTAANIGLLPLGYYGGITETYLPQPGSAAICAGSAALATNAGLFEDQRGFPMGPSYSLCSSGTVDAGAVQTNYVEVEKTGDAGSGSSDCNQTPNTPNPKCTLRDAVALANQNGGGDIDFAVSSVTLNPLNGTLEVQEVAAIIGSGNSQTTVNGNASGANPLSVFTVDSGATAALYGLTITGGYANGGAFQNNGGGILNQGTLAVLDSTVTGNVAAADGGGIENYGGTLIVADSTVNVNTAAIGGGISSENTGATASIVESTIYGNSDAGSSGAGAGISNSQTMSISGSTISSNSDSSTSPCGGGGINNSATLTLANSIVGGNTSTTQGCANFTGIYTDGGGNVIGGNGNPGSDPTLVGGTGEPIALSGLQVNGVNTSVQTMIPTPGSPAICAGLTSNIPVGYTTDERAYPLQPVGGYCASGTVDSGAVQTNYTSVQFVQQPSDVAVNADIFPAPTVEVLETDTLLSSNNTDGVGGISIILSATSGTFGGRLAVTDSNSPNLATFGSLFSSTAANGIDLYMDSFSITSSYSLPAATSSTFNVYGSATQLVVTAPAVVTAGTPFSVTVTAEDALGSTVPTDNDTVNLTITGQTAVLGTVPLSSGTGSISVTIPTAETVTLTGTDTTNAETGQSGNIVAATTLIVNTLADSSDAPGSCGSSTCSLRDALTQATADDTITFSVTGTITLTSALPNIPQNLNIQGPGATLLTISGAHAYRILTIGFSTSPTVSISGLTFANGKVIAGSVGAAIDFEEGTLTVTQCTFSGNSTESRGGAIVNEGGSLTVNNSTFSGNSADDGGAIEANISPSGVTAITNSTFEGNTAAQGGAVEIYQGSASITNSTFQNNSATVSTAYGGGGAVYNSGNLTINNNVFSDNTDARGTGAAVQNYLKTTNGSNNVYYNNIDTGGGEDDCYNCNSGSPGSNGNVLATSNPLAITLGYYGGPTQTLLPQPGSAAICAGLSSLAVDANSNPLTTDQRGFAVNPGYWQCPSGSVDAGAVQTNYITVQYAADGSDAYCNPNNFCTLRAAIDTANTAGHGDIAFLPSIHSITLESGMGTLALTGAGVNIVGPSANRLTINANATSDNPLRVFTVSSGATALLYGLTATGGYAGGSSIADSEGGGILNQGTLTVENTAIAGNSSGGNGGGISNYGRFSILDSTISGNLGGNLVGGGIVNNSGATMEIMESTIAGNSFRPSTLNTGGAGIFNDSNATLAVTDSTIAGNTATYAGSGGLELLGNVSLANTIVAGNIDYTSTDPTSLSNLDGSYTDLGGNVIGGNTNATTSLVNGTGAAITLSPLQLNGAGATLQTMIPLPGSATICAGLASNISSGVLTDERGYPNTNTSYPGFSSTTPCVDSGAAQTNYALAFITSTFLPIYSVNGVMYPQIQVALTESGAAATAATSPVSMTDNANVLTGTASANLSAGLATFADLIVPVAETNDTLTASVSLNPALTTPLVLLSTPSPQFNVEVPATLTYPTSSTLGGIDQLFTWQAGVGDTNYVLRIGSTGVGSTNLYDGPETTNTSVTVTNLPRNGETVYVRLFSLTGGVWLYGDYTFTAFTGSAATLNPLSGGSTLGGSSQLFTWSTGVGVSQYELRIGSTGAGSSNLYNGPYTTNTSVTVSGLPLNGETVYVRLFSLTGGFWLYNDYTFTAFTGTAATLNPLSSGSTLSGSSQLFTWTAGAGDTQFELRIGTTGGGSSNLYNGLYTTNTSVTVTHLPTNGETIYVRLSSLTGGFWRYIDYTFTAYTPPPS